MGVPPHLSLNFRGKYTKMLTTPDLYVGVFLILCGFGLSLFNLRRVLKEGRFSSILISENLLLMSVGIAFVSKSVYELNPISMEMDDEAGLSMLSLRKVTERQIECKFWMVLMSYGPLIISLVNSFLTLVINNYMHYRTIEDVMKKHEENTVQDLHEEIRIVSRRKRFSKFFQKYFSYIAIGLQWFLPLIAAISMYLINVHEKRLDMGNLRALSQSCMAMVDVSNDTCTTTQDYINETLQFRNYIPNNYLESQGNNISEANNTQIDSVIKNVMNVIAKFQNESNFVNFNVTSYPLFRKEKAYDNCMKVCYIDNKNLLLYMFLLCIVSYFVPITISVAILTKLHMKNLTKSSIKMYVSRELLLNILFWSPIMFDTILSLILCSYSMNGVRPSIFNVIANVYQAVKNVMNTKYFHSNTILPA